MQTGNSGYTPLELTSKIEYALLTLLELVNHANRTHLPLTIAEIASKHSIPERYLEQIITVLRRGGIVRSYRGSRGGYVLGREPRQISLLHMIALIDGERKQRELEKSPNLERQIIYKIWQDLNTLPQDFLANNTIYDLYQQWDQHQSGNPMYYI